MTFDDYDFAKPYISGDEYIIWQGRPQKKIRFSMQDILLFAFGLVWCALVASAVYKSWPTGDTMTKIMLPFMLVFGFSFTIGQTIFSKVMLFKTAYVITTRKIIRKKGKSIDTLEKDNMPEMRVKAYPDGSGSIRFGYLETRSSRNRGVSISSRDNPGIFNIENVDSVAKVQQAVYKMLESE